MTTTTRRTIRRNSARQIERIVAGGRSLKRFSIDNGFVGEDIAPSRIVDVIKRHFVEGRRTRLTREGDGAYTLCVHGNLWYEFQSDAEPCSRVVQSEQEIAQELHQALAAIDLSTVPVKSADRHIPRKEQAKLARTLFRELGLKGISVTTPSYSMAQSVDVRMPGRNDWTRDEQGNIDQSVDFAHDAANVANCEARERLVAILGAAFPNHDDRSDSMTDYFDYCWSISCGTN